MLDLLRIRRNSILASVAAAVALGAAAWLLLGPLWAIAGLVAGYLTPPACYVVGTVFISPSSAALIAKGRPEDALRRLRFEETSSRGAARKWPSQFNEVLAHNLIVKSDALHALHRYRSALHSADEGVTIYQALTADNPAKYLPYLSRAIDTRSRALAGLGRQAEAIKAIETAVRMFRKLVVPEPAEYLPVLAEALTCMAEWLADIDKNTEALAATQEAVGIFWHKMPSSDMPVYAARAALLEGRLLCQQGNYHDAARSLARGWKLATSQQQSGALSTATPALRMAYRASPDDFAAIWHGETNSRPPDWLTTT
jgi:tetratricopeptide (TPR) repeat protein